MPLLATPEDRTIFHALIHAIPREQFSKEKMGELLLAVGSYFLETPYEPTTLEQGAQEQLIINLRRMDCFTFVENVVVLARLIRQGMTSWRAFTASLQAIRYRHGSRKGYASRLHYFSDWVADNQEKGTLQDITHDIGGQRFVRNFSFMTTHRDRYPALQSPLQYRRMEGVEEACSHRSLYHLPWERLPASTSRIKNGDLIAITTDTEGLDVSHAGLAIYHKQRLHLLHASRTSGRVIISTDTLYRYLQRRQSRTGIMVARVL